MKISSISAAAAASLLLMTAGTALAAPAASNYKTYPPGCGDLKGRVLDAQGKPVVGAQVLLTGSNEYTITGKDGDYLFTCETMGTYTVKVSAATFQVFASSVIVKPDAAAVLDFRLQKRSLPNILRPTPASLPWASHLQSGPQNPFANLPQETFQGDLGLHSTARSR